VETALGTTVPRSLPATLIGLLAALVGPPLFVIVPDAIFGPVPSLAIQIVLQALYCGLAALVVWIVIRYERLPLQSIGLRRPGWSTLLWALVLYGVLAVLPLITAPLTSRAGSEGVEEGIRRLIQVPLWFRIVLGATGGFVEELLYRGYAIERLGILTGRLWLAGALSAIAFAVAHVPAWGLGFSLAADLPFGMVMTLFYLWRRDVIANALAHSTTLVIAMLTLE
jgi:membrane protease YdiL (CAAX protease family)